MPISCKVVLAGSLICLFVHLSCAQTQIPATAAPKPTGPPIPVLPPQSLSTVPVGVSADLNSLLAQVSSALPSGVNADGAWGVIDNDFAGNVGLKYKVWRDNPSIQISGNTVTLGLNIYYQFAIAQRVRNGIFVGGYSWHQVASCGYGEPPRQAHVTMAYQLSWNQNYHLNVTGKWTVSYGPCNLTAANFNGVPRVQSLVNPKIADTANKLQAAIEAVDFRQQVQNLWTALQTPIQTPQLHGDLYITPTGVGASPLNGNGTAITDSFTIYARTAIFDPSQLPPGAPQRDPFQPPPVPATLQLIPTPGNGAFQINTLGDLTFPDATAIAKQRLDGMPVNLMNLHSTMTVEQVGGNGSLAYILIQLNGDLQGSIYLSGKMVYDPSTNVFSIVNLALTPEEVSAFTQAMITSFQDPAFLASIESKLKWDMSGTFGSFCNDVNSRISSAPLGGGFVLHGNVSSVNSTYLAAYPAVCDPVFPPEVCIEGVTKDTFVIGLAAEGSLAVVHP